MDERREGDAPAGPGAFVALAGLLSWPVWIGAWLATGRPASLDGSGAMVAAVYAGSFAPGLAAAILSARAGRLRAWLCLFVRWRCGWWTYAAALLPVPLAMLTLTIALGYTPRPDKLYGLPPLAFHATLFPVSILNGLATAVLGAGPLGEEGGWRGYLLPRLLERGGELRAGLIVGVVWTLWHLPVMAMFADWRGGVPFAPYLPLYMMGVTGLSLVMVRVWRLGGSLIPCIWLHGVVNAVGGVAFEGRLWASPWSAEAGVAFFGLAMLLAAALLFALRGRAPVRTRAPA